MRTLTHRVTLSTSLAFERACVGTELGVAAHSLDDVIPEWSSFAAEVYGRLVDPQATLTVDDPLPCDRWAQAAHRRVDASPGAARLRAACAGSPTAAALATATLIEAVREATKADAMRERLTRVGGRAVDPKEAHRQCDALAELAARDDVDSATRDATSEAEIDMLRAAKSAEAIRESMAEAVAGAKAQTFVRSVADAADAADGIAEVVRTLRGCGVGGSSGRVEDDVPMGLLVQLATDPTMLAIVRMMGRLVSSAGAEVRDSETGRCDVVGVTLGGDVSAFVPVELSALGTDREDELMRRMIERSVVSWSMRGDDAVDSGDMLLMFDRSGSMKGERLTFARAVVGACIVLGRRQKRRVVVCAFDHEQDVRVMEKDGSGFGHALSACFLAARGGTQVALAFEACAPYAGKADALLVTDGSFHEREGEGARFLRASGGQVTVIGLDCEVRRHASWATRVVRVEDFGDAVAAKLVTATIKGR